MSDDLMDDLKWRYEKLVDKFSEGKEEMEGAPAMVLIIFASEILKIEMDQLEREKKEIRKLKEKGLINEYIDIYPTKEYLRRELKRLYRRARTL